MWLYENNNMVLVCEDYHDWESILSIEDILEEINIQLTLENVVQGE